MSSKWSGWNGLIKIVEIVLFICRMVKYEKMGIWTKIEIFVSESFCI